MYKYADKISGMRVNKNSNSQVSWKLVTIHLSLNYNKDVK